MNWLLSDGTVMMADALTSNRRQESYARIINYIKQTSKGITRFILELL
jgi:hypothetical protein